MAFDIKQIDTTTAPEPLLRELAAYYEIVEAEDIPGDPPTPAEAHIAEWRHAMSRYPVARWLLTDDDGIGAIAVATYDIEQNLENGSARIHVHPDKRGRGYARAIATPTFDHLERRGRKRLDTWVKDGDPAESLVRRLGLKAVYQDKRSRLDLVDLDMDLMRSWVHRAGERAPDYELVYYESPVPEEMLQQFCDLSYIMNTAPREDFEEEDEVTTPETWRELEDDVAASKGRLHNLVAVHRPTGDFAGFTQIHTQGLQPDLAWQWNTGVDPAHRNRGLGRWLKAAMIERIVADHPRLARVDTYNAGSNEPMLNINVEMGFKPVHVAHAWQGPLATVRERFRA